MGQMSHQRIFKSRGQNQILWQVCEILLEILCTYRSTSTVKFRVRLALYKQITLDGLIQYTHIRTKPL